VSYIHSFKLLLLMKQQKHRIQEDIKKKKVKLDQEKFKLQHLKMEVDSLEREESMISVNESFILSRLKAVEKSPEDIIKVNTNTHSYTAIPESSSSPARSTLSALCVPALFNMQINVAKNTLTGESSVLSTPDVLLKDFHQSTGLRVHDDVQKCVCALSSQQASRGQNGVSELSANEVGHLLRNATMHCQAKHQNWNRVEHDLGKQPGHYDVLQRHKADKDSNEHRNPRSEHHCCDQDSRLIKNEGRSQQTNRTGSCGSARHQPGSMTRSSSRITEPSRRCVALRTHDQEMLTHTRFSYTPCYIPAVDYISEEEHYPSLHQSNRQTGSRAPLTGDDPAEPITAIFMGFQSALDESRQEFEGSLKAELVIVEDDEDYDDSNMKEKKSHVPKPNVKSSPANKHVTLFSLVFITYIPYCCVSL
uniref:Palmdelphin n=1 Tax=Neolamprologus brichardi TaxID=32507 RepID=A0A3Q4HEZ5_NEOBR